MIAALRDGRGLTRARVIAAGWFLALAELTCLVMLALWQHGVIGPGIPAKTSSDFVSFYAAGKLALAGTAPLAYDQAAHFLAEQRFTIAGAPYQFFFYPPVFLLLCIPLSLPPYYAAFYGFEIATLGAFIWCLTRVTREASWTATGPFLAFAAVYWTFGLGQNAFLSAALFAGFTLLCDERPWLAGLCLGLLCYKPHFGLLAPVALACGGHWRAFFSAGITVALLILLSAGLFGVETWLAWWQAFSHSDAVYSSGRIDYAGIVTPFGAARFLGVGVSGAYAIQAAVSAAMAAVVGLVWRRVKPLAIRAATLLAAVPLAVPLLLLYDTLVLVVAIAWLVRSARETGFLPWEKLTLALILLASIGGYPIASMTGIPLGPVVSLAILALALRRGRV